MSFSVLKRTTLMLTMWAVIGGFGSSTDCQSEEKKNDAPAFTIEPNVKGEEVDEIDAKRGCARVFQDGSTSVDLVWAGGKKTIPEVRLFGHYFQEIKVGDVIPVLGRMYRLTDAIGGKSYCDEATFEPVDLKLEQAWNVTPERTSLLVPLKGETYLDLTGEAGSLKVETYSPAVGNEPAYVQLHIYLPPWGQSNGALNLPKYQSARKTFREGDLVPIPPIYKQPPPQVNLRIHRNVAPDPAKHIPGWVELRFEPKDKPTPDKPGNDKSGTNKPTNDKPAGPETPSKTKPENTKQPTDTKPKPK